MAQIILNEDMLYQVYDHISKHEYSFLLCRVKDIHLFHYLYGKENNQILYQNIESILKQSLDSNAYIYRIYSNYFVIFIKSQDPFIIIHTIYEIDNHLLEYDFNNIEHKVSLAFGIFFLRYHIDFFHAYDFAKFALTSSKDLEKYNTTFDFYDKKNIENAKQQFMLLPKLEDALQQHEIEIYLQSKVNAKSFRIQGAEALIRWVHQGKEVPLKDFMPLIDKNSFIRRIDLFVFEEVCKLLIRWKKENIPLIRISINISKASFEDGFYYLKEIETIHEHYQIDKRFIEFELSEEICFEDNHRLHQFLNMLYKYGYHCSLDDFGSGYSSFLSLTYLPIKTIKLDASFCLGKWNEKRKIILKHLLQLLELLSFEIIVEGVETKEIADFFKNYPNLLLQGFYFCRPISVANFEEYYKISLHLNNI